MIQEDRTNEVVDAGGSGSHSFRSAIRFDPEKAVVATVTSDRDTTVFVVCLEAAQEQSSPTMNPDQFSSRRDRMASAAKSTAARTRTHVGIPFHALILKTLRGRRKAP